MNHRRATFALSFLVLVASMGSVAYAAPTFEWTPSSLTQTIARGESKTVTVTFKASQNERNVVVRVVPELQPYITQVSPSSFQTIQQGTTTTLNVTFQAALNSTLGTYQGTIQLRSQGTLAKPLPVRIVVVASNLPPGLPPDPGAAGMATIAGIDSDNNGVRDDIQRYIALTYPASAKERAALTSFAKGMQAALLTAGSKANALVATEHLSNAQYCLWYLYGLGSSPLWQELRAQYLNTRDRSRAYGDYGHLLNAEVFKVVPQDQQKARCDFNPDALPN